MNMNLNDYENQINYANKTYQNNKINLRNREINYPINNIPNKYTKMNNNLILYDKRLVLCLKYLGLNNYISNFTKRGLKFEDFLSLSNSDLTILKIPPSVQDIIQKFMISYFNYGSMYTIEEIIHFFQTQKVARLVNANERNNQNRNDIKYKSVNDKRRNNFINKYNKQNMNININNNIPRNMNQYNKNINRPKSQKNKLIDKANYFNSNIQNNFGKQSNTNNNNINQNKMINFKTSNNNINNIKRKNNKINVYNNTTNSNISSMQSSQNNFYSSSLDNFSHMAMKENSPQILNIMKMAKSKNININNINQLKKNLVKNFQKSIKGNNINNINLNNQNKKVIKNNKCKNNVLSRSTSKDIINRMDEVLKRNQSRKKSTNTSSNLNMNKGYHSDGYLKEKRELQKQIITNNLNNINLDGYEINTYYAGDVSKFSSLYGNSNNNSISSELKQIKKGGKINAKMYKQKKINEEQARKIEYLLSHGGNSSLKSGNNDLILNNYNINNDDELSLISKTNLTNYTNLTSNNNNQTLFHKKNNYMNQANNNMNSVKQKNLLIQRQNYKNKISKNKPNNFNTFASNRGNISSNNYQNNKNIENIKLINNIIHIPNTQNRLPKNDGPVQISNINRKRINNNINIPLNYNNKIIEGENYFNPNNNSMGHYSQGQNNKYSNNININNYPINKYINNFISNNQQHQQKKRIKSYDKQTNNRVYTGIHNINNNINNININNINYDGKRLSEGFNNFIDLDMKMNYHRTQNNFYNSNNLLNINDEYDDIY